MKLEIEINENQVWQAVFGSRPFSFGSWWNKAEYIGNSDMDKAGSIELTFVDEYTNEKITKVITAEDLVKALPIANKQVHMDMFDLDDYDAICADALLQTAFFGKVLFG